jgi:VanZ family protein
MPKIPLKIWRLALGLCLISVMVLALMPDPPEIPSPQDIKTNRLLAFAVIMILGNYSFYGKRLQVIFGSLAYGVLIEALQLLTTYRHGQFSDVGVDGVGIMIGFALVVVIDFVLPAPSPINELD